MIRWKWAALLGIAAAIGIFGFMNQATTTSADGAAGSGSIDDPLITKSYLDQQLSALVKQEVQTQLAGTQQSPAPSAAPSTVPTVAPTATPAVGNTSSIDLTVIQLQAGQTLYAGAGSEFIVRTGKTVAVSGDGNGIPDVTAGKDIAANSAVELNHLLIFPREGRGIKPDPKYKGEIYVMVRGNYLIMNADGTKITP